MYVCIFVQDNEAIEYGGRIIRDAKMIDYQELKGRRCSAI